MKLLFVNACVRPQSRTLALCKEYIRLLSEQCDVEITEIDPIKSDMRSFSYEMLVQRDKDIADNDFSSDRYFAAKAFAEADAILIGAPYWDCSFPSSVKVFFEHICVNSLTFRYEKGECVSMCRAGQLCYITTAGGYIGDKNSAESYIRDMCRMFGIEKVSFFSAEGIDIYGNDTEAILEKTSQQIEDSFKQGGEK